MRLIRYQDESGALPISIRSGGALIRGGVCGKGRQSLTSGSNEVGQRSDDVNRAMKRRKCNLDVLDRQSDGRGVRDAFEQEVLQRIVCEVYASQRIRISLIRIQCEARSVRNEARIWVVDGGRVSEPGVRQV